MSLKRRWYDNYDDATKAFEILKNLDNDSKKRLSADLTEIIRQIKDFHKEEEEPELSIGIQRVIGLYHQTVNNRRWYDTNNDLKYVLKTMSTLPTEDFLNIMEGLTVSLKD